MDHFDVKRIRLTMGLTQGQFSRKLVIAQSTIAKIESGALPVESYQERINELKEIWKTERIKVLEKEMEYVQSL